MSNYDFIVYGNSVGALIASLELAKTNKVALVNPTPNWGAHFGGLKVDGVNFDIGMNFFEFSTFYQQSGDLMTYDPVLRNDSARFFDLVKKYFEDLLPFVQSPAPQCTILGHFANDIILGNDLEILNKLPADLKSKIREELEQIIAAGPGPLHASNKKKNEALFLNTNYREVSVANHGLTFHELFVEPICQKIFNLPAAEMPAIFHRIAWAPLFYPETLLKGFDDHLGNLSPTLFHYPAAGFFAKSIELLTAKIMDNGNIDVIRDKVSSIATGDSYTFQFADRAITSGKLVWCSDLQTLLNLSGVNTATTQFKKASLVLVLLTLDRKIITRKFSTLYLCDSDEVIYRITNQDEMGQTDSELAHLIIEYNTDMLEKAAITDENAIISHTNEALQRLGITGSDIPAGQFVVKYFKNALNLPTLDNNSNFEGMQQQVLSNLKNIELVGVAAGFVANSFNDQVVQGLKLGVKYN